MSRIKLVEIISTVPYPVRAGGTMALFSMIDCLRKNMDIDILFLLPSTDRKSLEQLQSLWPDVRFHVYTPRKDKRFFLQKLGERIYAKGVFTSDYLRHYVTPFSKYSPELLGFIDRMVGRIKPDIIQTEFYPNQDLVYAFPDGIKRVFVQHEIHYVVSEMWLKAHNLSNNNYARAAYRMLKAEEVAAMNQYDMILTLNEADAKRMRKDGVTTVIAPSPVGVIDAVKRNPCSYANKLIFIGAGGHPPNVEAVGWFVSKVWPHILLKHPDTEFHIIGSWSEPIQKPFLGVPNMVFDGFVDDLGKALDGSIAVVPILSGSGIRMKILDAVNYGTTFISTTVGALDMGFEDGRDCFIADAPEDFTGKLLSMIENPSIVERFYENSRKVYAERYSADELAAKRLDYYKQLLSH